MMSYDVPHRFNNQGITLIELLVVILIVGILAAVAVPVYTDYLVRARRADAKTILEQVRAAQEMWRAEHGTYAIDDGDGDAVDKLINTMGVPRPPVGDYTWAFTALGNDVFTAQATPITPRQSGDGSLTIDQTGTKWPADKWAK